MTDACEVCEKIRRENMGQPMTVPITFIPPRDERVEFPD